MQTRSKIFNLWGKAVTQNESLGMSAGEQIIDISYIDNIIDAYLQLIRLLEDDQDYVFKGKVYAISAKERMSLKDLSKLYEKVTRTSIDIQWGGRPYREREVMLPWTKGIPVPDWEQKVSLENAIKKVMTKEKM
ncbi:UDP-glucose 4-epimerase [hydrothermal vent metagenome]|uniref:UDP-glucose 4-epimerase n=1 Tax=hydrothermal vent metagenome TaxID=652676 RepID=A0A1W1CM92_9ZZZZ